MTITFETSVYDEDGDTLTWNLTTFRDGEFDGRMDAISPGVAGYPNDRHGNGSTTIFGAGRYSMVLAATDGKATAEDIVEFDIVGTIHFTTLLTTWLNVTEACPQCTVGDYVLSGYGALGGDGCKGFHQGQNGTDCVFFPLREEWKGKSFELNAKVSEANVEAEFRRECAVGADKQQMHLNEGFEERGTIREDSGCLVVWTFDKAPARIRFLVY